MHELAALLDAGRRLLAQGRKAYLGTVVATKGSTYRGVGARILIDDAGDSIGSISGGCLEGDLTTRTLEAEHLPLLVDYDLAEDEMWSLGIGCNGAVKVLVERLDERLLAFLAAPLDRRAAARRVVLADGTWVEVDPETARPALEPDGYVDVVRPPTMVYVFGAGHDAIPLVRTLEAVGFAVTVVDARPAYLTTERFPGAALMRTPVGDPSFRPEAGSFAVVMQHHKARDTAWLKQLVRLPFRYIGLLGPRARTLEILREIEWPADDPRLFFPVGLDIGAEGPEAVAVSVAAECLAVANGREGGFLRNRTGPIHG